MSRIAHITFHYDISTASGVLSNNKAKLGALHQLGCFNYDFYIINELVTKLEAGINYVKINSNNLLLSYFTKYFAKSDYIKDLINLDNYDKLIIRYPLSDRSMIDLVNENEVYFELHSTVAADLKSSGYNNNKFNYALFAGEKLRKILDNRYYKKVYLGAKGFVAVTDEIKNIESRKIGSNSKFTTISNGIDTQLYNVVNYKEFDGKTLNILISSSTDSYWNGIQRLIDGIEKYNGSVHINFYIVGAYVSNSFYLNSSYHKIIYTGLLNNAQLAELYKEINIAVGTLGLYKKGMTEAAALKVREYVSRGIPFIKAYYDTDIDNMPELRDYYLDFPNDDSLIDINRIIEFLLNMKGKSKDISNFMHNQAIERLDWKIKMKKYIDFIG